MSWCNHSPHPNAEICWKKVGGKTLLELYSTRPIQCGEEVTIYYANLEEYEQSGTWAI